MAQNQYQKQKFRIVSCSSEEVDYPVQELLSQSPQSKGWQSARFCDYPQEITFQFMSPIQIKQVQFLSHQSKIASKIEIYVYLPDPSLPYQNHDIKYKKLGYLSLDSNERTSYQARELKSVYIDAPCQFVKLLLHKQHINKYNLFNQVGLIAVSCFGEQMGNAPQKSLQDKQHYNEIQFETQFDQMTLERLRDLEKAKERAIQAEDYEEAKRIKEAVDRLKQIGIQLRQLDERKIIAVQNEDYDSARVIKAEIERLRNAVAPEFLVQQHQQQHPEMQNQQYLQQQQQQEQQMMMQQQQQMMQNQQQMQQGDPMNQMHPQDQQAYNQQYQQQQNMNNYNQQQAQQFQQQHDEFQQNQQNYYDQQQNAQLQEQQEFQMQNQTGNREPMDGRNHDEQVIPAMKNNNKPDDDGGITGGNKQQDDFEAEPLSLANQKLAEPLIPIMGEEVCRQIFAKNWPTKVKGLEYLADQAANPTQLQGDQVAIFTAMMAACTHTINDKIANVVISTIQVFDNALNKYRSLQGPPKTELANNIDTVLLILVEKLGESKRLSEPAENAFFSAGNNGMVNNAHIINILAKGQNLPKKIQNSHKHIIARLALLDKFVQKYKVNNKQVPMEPVVEFAVKQITHQNKDIREKCVKLLVDIHKIVGDQKLRPLIQGIPQQQLDVLDEEIKGGTQKPQGMGGATQTKEQVTTNIKQHGQKSPAKQRGGDGATDTKNKKISKNAIECEFCLQSNPAWSDSNKLDIHLWKECPMLQNCPECAQVIEVSSLATHFLEECQQRRKYRKCPRCKEPVKLEHYEQHTSDMSCVQAKPITVANRCPLCHQDIPAGMSGWTQHITIDGCPNNEKTVG